MSKKKSEDGDIVSKDVAKRLKIFWDWVHDEMKPGEPVGKRGLWALTGLFCSICSGLLTATTRLEDEYLQLVAPGYYLGGDGRWWIQPLRRRDDLGITEYPPGPESMEPLWILQHLYDFLWNLATERMLKSTLQECGHGWHQAANLQFYAGQYRAAIALLEER